MITLRPRALSVEPHIRAWAILAAIAALAHLLRHLSGYAPLSPLIVSLALGMLAARLLPAEAPSQKATGSAGKAALRLGVALLGLQITAGSLVTLGTGGLLIAGMVVIASFAVTFLLAWLLGVDHDLAILIGAGTAICGASAIVAVGEAAKSRRDDVGYALVCVTILGTVGMIALPPLGRMAGLTDYAFGVWAGASLQEVAQAVGAGFSFSDAAGEFATLEKLARVVMLGPVAAIIGMAKTEGRPGLGSPGALIPSYLLAFFALMTANSLGAVPAGLVEASRMAVPFLLSAGLAAIGLQSRPAALFRAGWRPLAVGAGASVAMAVLALLLTGLVVGKA